MTMWTFWLSCTHLTAEFPRCIAAVSCGTVALCTCHSVMLCWPLVYIMLCLPRRILRTRRGQLANQQCRKLTQSPKKAHDMSGLRSCRTMFSMSNTKRNTVCVRAVLLPWVWSWAIHDRTPSRASRVCQNITLLLYRFAFRPQLLQNTHSDVAQKFRNGSHGGESVDIIWS